METPQFIRFFLNALFTERCVGCKTPGTPLCEKCLTSARSAERETAHNIIAVFDYREPVIKRALWELKYKNKRAIAEVLGTAMYERALEDISELRTFSPGLPILVLPIPLARSRKRERGYNQALLLAQYFVKSAPPGVCELRTDSVYKIRHTPPQARIANRTKRLLNIRGVFSVQNEAEIKGRTIIIVDDITTTGGTITEIMKILTSAGAKKVVGLAVAH